MAKDCIELRRENIIELKRETSVPMASADIDQSDVDAVIEVMKSGRLTMGPKIEEFETATAAYCGARHAIAVNSGTAALHMLSAAAGVTAGDEVITTSFSFVASTNCFLYLGATPVFVDIEPSTYCIDPSLIREAITNRTKAIIAVDVFGHPADWDRIEKLADEYDLKLIADSCESLGAEYKGKKTGPFGIGGAFAYFPNKQMTTGEGGMIVTDDDEVALICRSLRNQGRSQSGSWLAHERLGYNYRITEMSAALGVSQLRRIEDFIEKRRLVAATYDALLSDQTQIRVLQPKPNVRVSYFVYVVELLKANRDEVIHRLAARGVPSRAYFVPIHQQPYITRFVKDYRSLPVTESAGSRTIALPFHNNLSDDDVAYVVGELKSVLKELG